MTTSGRRKNSGVSSRDNAPAKASSLAAVLQRQQAATPKESSDAEEQPAGHDATPAAEGEATEQQAQQDKAAQGSASARTSAKAQSLWQEFSDEKQSAVVKVHCNDRTMRGKVRTSLTYPKWMKMLTEHELFTKFHPESGLTCFATVLREGKDGQYRQ